MSRRVEHLEELVDTLIKAVITGSIGMILSLVGAAIVFYLKGH